MYPDHSVGSGSPTDILISDHIDSADKSYQHFPISVPISLFFKM